MTDQPPRPDHEFPVPDDVPTDQPQLCAQCQTELQHGATVTTENSAFCTTCYEGLKAVVEEHMSAQSQNINWLGAVIVGGMGAVLGAGAWWLFTVLTNIHFGLVAVAIAFATGIGVVTGSGGKRGLPLQVLSAALAVAAYFLGTYWVMRTFVLRELSDVVGASLPLLPTWEFLRQIVGAFGAFEFIFLGIVLWQAWVIPRATKLKRG